MNDAEKTKYVEQIFAKTEDMFFSIRSFISAQAADFITTKMGREKETLLKIMTGGRVEEKVLVPARETASKRANIDEKYFTKKSFNMDNF